METILLVEDEALWQQGITSLLEASGQYVLKNIVDTVEAGWEVFSQERPDWVLLDWKLKGAGDGLQLGQKIQETGFPVERVILISGSEASQLPQHPFFFVPKSRIASDLLSLMQSVTSCK